MWKWIKENEIIEGLLGIAFIAGVVTLVVWLTGNWIAGFLGTVWEWVVVLFWIVLIVSVLAGIAGILMRPFRR